MVTAEVDVLTENDQLKRQFKEADLLLGDVWSPSPSDPELENRQLRRLWDWVETYRRYPNRGVMENKGYEFPPVEPDCDPDSDWVRFERWMTGQPVEWNFVQEYGPVMDPNALTDAQVEVELQRVTELLGERGVRLMFTDGVPARAILVYLKRELETSKFEYLAPGTEITVMGCTGWCEDCFQQRWCETARDIWAEEAAAM